MHKNKNIYCRNPMSNWGYKENKENKGTNRNRNKCRNNNEIYKEGEGK